MPRTARLFWDLYKTNEPPCTEDSAHGGSQRFVGNINGRLPASGRQQARNKDTAFLLPERAAFPSSTVRPSAVWGERHFRAKGGCPIPEIRSWSRAVRPADRRERCSFASAHRRALRQAEQKTQAHPPEWQSSGMDCSWCGVNVWSNDWDRVITRKKRSRVLELEDHEASL